MPTLAGGYIIIMIHGAELPYTGAPLGYSGSLKNKNIKKYEEKSPKIRVLIYLAASAFAFSYNFFCFSHSFLSFLMALLLNGSPLLSFVGTPAASNSE